MRVIDKIFVLTGLFLLLLMFDCRCEKKEMAASHFVSDNENALAILFTTNVQGYVEPCGCTSDPLGGIGRLAAVVNEAEQAFGGRVVFIDAGNLLFDTTKERSPADLCQDNARIDLLLSTYHDLGIVGLVPGPYDDARGIVLRESLLKKHHIPVLGGGGSPGSIVERKGILVGIVGFRADNDVEAKKQKATLQSELRRLRQAGAQITILVAQAPLQVTKEILHDLNDVDVVIQGRDTGELPLPVEALSPKGPWIVSAGMQGQFLGVLDFRGVRQQKREGWVLDDRKQRDEQRTRLLSERAQALKTQISNSDAGPRTDFLRNRLNDVNNELLSIQEKSSAHTALSQPHFVMRHIALQRDIEPSQPVQQLLLAYEAKIPELVSKCEENIDCEQAKPHEATYVGVETCKTCHAAPFDIWQKASAIVDGKDEKGSPIKRKLGHSIAWTTLEKMHKTADRNCVGCHSIGFMKPGGYCKVSEVAFRKDVQCESCHGPGSLHAQSGDKKLIKREVPESVCRSCHHVPHIPTTKSFVYSEKVQLILGEGHGHSLLMRLKHGTAK